MNRTLGTLLRWIREILATAHMTILRGFAGRRVIPLGYWSRIQCLLWRAFKVQDTLLPPQKWLKSSGNRSPVPELRQLLAERELGTWSLDHWTIAALWKALPQRHTRFMEFGAGISTLLLAQHCRLHGGYVLSVEQRLETKTETEESLSRHGLRDFVTILHAPTNTKGVYQLAPAELAEALDGKPVDCVLIDGPAGAPGCRRWTLPLILDVCRNGARWFLDDAVRDGELDALRHWSEDSRIRVQGILPCGKGLATGTIRRQA